VSFNSVEISEHGGRPSEYFRIELDGTVYRYTNRPLTTTLSTGDAEIDGTYTATSISLSEIEHARDLSSLRVGVTVPRDNAVAALFQSYLPDAAALIAIYRKHESDSEVIAWMTGTIRSCDWQESTAKLVVEPTLSKVRRLGLRQRFQPVCNLELYGTRCGVNRNDFKTAVTVSAIDGATITVTGMPSVAAGYYNGGYVQTADGSRRFIMEHDGADLTLLLSLEDLAVSDTLDIYAGCDRTQTTCRTKFYPSGGSLVAGVGNIRNYFGFFTLPGRNPFTQGGLTAGGPTGFASIDSGGIVP